ncbi:hypothetical protein EPN29_13235 [bacterium]|nr:MAG: hypothetical protein EPN29_13235 [bacterium]
MVRTRLASSALAALAAGALALAPAPRTGATAISPIGFETPTLVDPIHTNGEPDIAVDPFGRVFVSGPTGTGTQRSTWFGSVDGGHTYRVMAQKVTPSSIVGIPAPQPGGGDTDINFDRSGKQYFADLYGLVCLRVAVTGPTNSGASDQENVYPGGCGTANAPGADRQWLAVYDPSPDTPNQSAYRAANGKTPLIYLEYNNLIGPGPNGGAQWNMSTDGLDFINATAGEVPSGTGVMYTPFGADGYPALDQVTGKVFQAAGCTTANGCRSTGLWLNIGTPDSTGTLHFLDDGGNGSQDLTRLIRIADTPTGSPDTLFSVLSMDSGRNLFAVWAISSTNPAQRQVFVSAASAASGWADWSTPIQVSDGSSATGDAANVFPWIKAGGPGRADAVWYGSDKQVDPSSHNQQTWNVFMSQVVFPTGTDSSLTGAAPVATLVKVTPHPMHYDDICLTGTDCIRSTGNRNLADFFQVNIDRSGAAEIVYDDTSNGLIQNPIPSSIPQVADHSGAGVITVARQSSGMGLFGTAVSGPSNAPVSGLPDPAGDALYPVIGGTNQPGMDIRSSQLSLSADGKTLNVTMQVGGDLTNPAPTLAGIPGATNLQYLTRWQLGNTIYYAAMENSASNRPSFYAGAAQSIDLCSVSACFPHVLTYPEPGAGPTFTGKTESGTIGCPAAPSATNPCTLTVSVNVADIGGPTAGSRLEEVGAYTLAATLREGDESNATAESDTVPLEIDGVCCNDFEASVQNGGPGPCHEADGDGHVPDGHGGQAQVRFDQDACEDGAAQSIQADDPSTGDSFQAGQVSAITFNDALSNVTISGTGTHNGNPVKFTLVAVGGGAGIGAASLTLSDGYAAGGTLLDGSITL